MSNPAIGSKGSVEALLGDVEASVLEHGRAVHADPSLAAHWDELEGWAADSNTPDGIAALYRACLAGTSDERLLEELVARAQRFHEEWYPEDAPELLEVLTRALRVDALADAAFQRLTVVHTSHERWSDLLAVYDARIAATRDGSTRVALIEEALQTARDFAKDDARALAYVRMLSEAAPMDTARVEALEKALERAGRWDELADALRARAAREGGASAAQAKLRVARIDHERRGQSAQAAADAASLLKAEADVRAGALELLVAVADDAAADVAARRTALRALRADAGEGGRDADAVRYLEALVAIAAPEDQARLAVEAGDLELRAGDVERARAFFESAFAANPASGEARTRLRQASERLSRLDEYVASLERAAELVGDPIAGELRAEVASVRATALGDTEGAIAAYERLLASTDVREEKKKLSRTLADLKRAAGRAEEALTLLEQEASLTPEGKERRDILRETAMLALELGDTDRAVAAWRLRIESDPADREALDALVVLLERAGRAAELVMALRRRVALAETRSEERRDLLAVARIQGETLGDRNASIATLVDLAHRFGEDAEIVDRLVEAYEATERHADLAEILVRTEAREGSHLATVRARLGDVYREYLGDPVAAAAAYERALDASARNDEARAGLAILADEPVVSRRAVESLAKSYAATDEWEPELALVERRIEHAVDADGRVAILARAATLAETRANAPSRAVDLLARALVLAPGSTKLEAELERLAASAGDLSPAITAFEQAAAAASDTPSRKAHLAKRAAELATAAGDHGRALTAGLVAFGANPDDIPLSRALASAAGDAESVERVHAALAARATEPQVDTALMDVLADLERRAAHPGLVSTLRRIANRRPSDLDSLVEALRVSVERGAGAEALEVAERLWDRAARLLRAAESASGNEQPESAGAGALEYVLSHLESGGSFERAARLAGEGARVLAPSRRPALVLRAAAYAEKAGASPAELVERYRDVLRDDPRNASAHAALAAVLEREGRLAELLQLRLSELGTAADADARLTARLGIVDLVDRIERNTSRIDVLRANLEERPGHEESVEAIVTLLRRERRMEELVDLLAEQAAKVGAPASASMWRRVAAIAEGELRDRERARRAYEALVEIEPTAEAYDALAVIANERGDVVAAARWLERRLAVSSGNDLADVSLRLAVALRSLGRRDRALEVLERAFEQAPANREVRDLLLETHRAEQSHDAVARIASKSVAAETDPGVRLALAKEAATLFVHELDRSEDAIPMLELASELSPDERPLRLELADAYRKNARNDAARAVLERIVEEYGRRRTPERAMVHAELGKVLEEMGDLPGAIAQLDQATQIAGTNAPMFLALGRLCSRAGQADKAEKTYRTLLVLVRRRAPDDAVDVGVGEVLFELASIAEAKGEADKAKEQRDAAIEAAASSDGEAIRFVDALASRGAGELALAGVTARMAARQGDPSVELERRHASALGATNRAAEALDVRLDTLGRFPSDARVRRDARKAAVALGAARRFVDTAERVGTNLRRDTDAHVADALALARAECLEQDLGEVREAAGIYESLVEHGIPEVRRTARVGLARTLRAAGDDEAERAVQSSIRADANASADDRIEALYRIAEIDLAHPDRRRDAIAALRTAVDEDGRASRAAAMLRRVAEEGGLDADGFRAYEELARGAGDPMALLDYLLCKAERPDATMAEVREAVDKALALGQASRARELLLRLAENATSLSAGDARVVFTTLATIDEKSGDVGAALRWLARAADVSDASEARTIRLRIARAASQPGGDPAMARDAFVALLGDDPSDEAALRAFVAFTEAQGDDDAVRAALGRVDAATLETPARSELRLALAARLDALGGATPEVIEVLRSILGDDPTCAQAAEQLERIYEREGFDGERARLLEARVDALLGAGPSEELGEVAVRAADLHARVDMEAAKGVLRRAVSVVTEHRGVLLALLALADENDDATELAHFRERLVASEPEESVVDAALRAAAEWERLEDEEGVVRALELGVERLGDDDVLRPKLEMLIRRRGDDARLVALLVRRLRVVTDPLDRRTLGLEAAGILRERLGDPARAAVVLEALLVGPFDLGTLLEYVECLVSAARRDDAIQAVTRALEDVGAQEELRVALLELRARLRLDAGDTAFALADLEAIGPEHAARTFQPMVDVLARIGAEAAEANDAERARAAALRLASLLESNGHAEAARDTLLAQVERAPDDVEALEWLARLQKALGDNEGLMVTTDSLVARSTGESQIVAVLTFAEACQAAGRLERARELLEHVLASQNDRRIVESLRTIYLAMGEHREVAGMLLAEAESESGARKLELLLEAARIFMDVAGDPASAIEPLRQAQALKPDDLRLTVQVVDAMLAANVLEEAGKILESSIAAHPKRRTPELSMLQHRMGRYARATGDRDLEMQWMVASLECDKNNVDSAADLANVAMELGDFETALNALRAITLARVEGPISRAMAYLLQAKIAHQRGESRRALLWARKAREVDPALPEVEAFLRELGESA